MIDAFPWMEVTMLIPWWVVGIVMCTVMLVRNLLQSSLCGHFCSTSSLSSSSDPKDHAFDSRPESFTISDRARIVRATTIEIGCLRASLETVLETLDTMGQFILCSGKYAGMSFEAAWANDRAAGFAYRKYCSSQGGFIDSAYRLYGVYANMRDVAIQRNLYRIRECGWYAEASNEFQAFFSHRQSQTFK